MNQRSNNPRNNKRNQRNYNAPKEFVFQKTIFTRRVNKMTKGGRNISFCAISVVKTNDGSIGVGVGKTRSMSTAIDKSYENARKNTILVKTIRCINYKYRNTKLIIRKRAKNIVCANYYIGEILDAANLKNVSCKVVGSTNTMNVVFALFASFRYMESIEGIIKQRENLMQCIS